MSEETTFQNACASHRESLERTKEQVKLLVDGVKQAPDENFGVDEDKSEMIANLMLSYRHLEDARMRLGKAIQASDGGVSMYDTDGGSA